MAKTNEMKKNARKNKQKKTPTHNKIAAETPPWHHSHFYDCRHRHCRYSCRRSTLNAPRERKRTHTHKQPTNVNRKAK